MRNGIRRACGGGIGADPIDLEWDRPGREPEPSRWDLLDPEGRFLGLVTFPPRFTPRLAGDRRMLGILRDELDVQQVARFSIAGAR